jgi:hypothetical protein
MPGILQVDQINPNATTITLGASGNTITTNATLQASTINNTSGSTLITQTNATTITLGASGQTVALPSQSISYAAISNAVNFRNRIINGDMRIDQRNAGASVTPTATGYYSCDRWTPQLTQASKFSVQQQTTTVPTGFSYAQQFSVVSTYSVGAGDYFGTEQRIEGYNLNDLNWGTANALPVTLSFWAYANNAGTYACSLFTGGAGCVLTYTLPANTWTKVVLPFPASTTYSLGSTTNGAGVFVRWTFSAGSNFQTATTNTWQAGNPATTSSAFNWIGTAGATFYITGVQLEAGSNASGFELLPIDVSLLRCQRYYEILVPYRLTGVTYVANGDTRTSVSWHVKKRTNPSVSSSGTLNVIYVGNGAAGANIDMGTFGITGSVDSVGVASISNYSAFSGGVMAWGDNSYGSFTFYGSAEL